jgi:hypothetical protein
MMTLISNYCINRHFCSTQVVGLKLDSSCWTTYNFLGTVDASSLKNYETHRTQGSLASWLPYPEIVVIIGFVFYLCLTQLWKRKYLLEVLYLMAIAWPYVKLMLPASESPDNLLGTMDFSDFWLLFFLAAAHMLLCLSVMSRTCSGLVIAKHTGYVTWTSLFPGQEGGSRASMPNKRKSVNYHCGLLLTTMPLVAIGSTFNDLCTEQSAADAICQKSISEIFEMALHNHGLVILIVAPIWMARQAYLAASRAVGLHLDTRWRHPYSNMYPYILYGMLVINSVWSLENKDSVSHEWTLENVMVHTIRLEDLRLVLPQCLFYRSGLPMGV